MKKKLVFAMSYGQNSINRMSVLATSSPATVQLDGNALLREIIHRKSDMRRRGQEPELVRLTAKQWSVIADYIGVKEGVDGYPKPDRLLGIPMEIVA